MTRQGDFFYLYDDKETTETRFVSFLGNTSRFDLAITSTNRFYGKKIVFDIQSGLTAIIGPDDLKEPGYLAQAFKLSEEEAADLHSFLKEVV
ncbi:DUF3055 domain-containing protein [Bacillaceae bacterium]